MIRAAFICLLITFAAVGAFWQDQPAGEANEPLPPIVDGATPASSQAQTHPGYVVARFRKDVPPEQTVNLLESLGGRTAKTQPISGLHRIKARAGVSARQLLDALERNPLVEEAGLSHVTRIHDAPNDTNYSYQWHMHDTEGGVWAESAWDVATNRGQGVVVAVIDTGVAYEDFTGPGGLSTQTFVQAPDLAATTFVAPWDFYNNDVHANDDNGHGSHTAGTITQDTNNAYGVAGVASNNTIMPVKVLAFDGTGFDDDLVESIYYAVDNGADVINMSLGFTGTGAPNGDGEFCTAIVGLNAALDYAYDSGVIVVASSGNDASSTVACPAAHPTVIAVGATRFDGQLASYSNGGSQLDVTAPGGDNLDQNGDGFSDGVLQETFCYDWLTLLFLGTYDTFCNVFYNGTSMASPHVAGVAALLLGEDPSLPPDDVRFYIESTARDRGVAGWDPSYGWGALDARAAIDALTDGEGVTTSTPQPAATDTPVPTVMATPTPLEPTPAPVATNTPTVTPSQVSLPDLVVSGASDPPRSKRAGGFFRVTETVQNIGGSDAGPSIVRFYLSADSSLSAGDMLLDGSRLVSSLSPGSASTGTTRVEVPPSTAPGVYFLLVCADDTEVVAESAESNNCLSSDGTIEITSGGGGNGTGPRGR